jgi:hypothetical protein
MLGVEMDKNGKIIFILFGLVQVIYCREFMEKGFAKFYLYEIDKTGTTTGVVLKSDIDNSGEGTSIECSYLYRVSNAEFKKFESISVDDTLKRLSVGDKVPVRYNSKRPWYGTIDTSHNLWWYYFFTLVMVLWILYSIILTFVEAIKYFRQKRIRID